MTFPSKDILIQCQSCGIENIFNSYTPDKLILCSQCRDRLIEPNLPEVFNQFNCQDCGLSIFTLKKTPFIVGEAKCRCDGTNLKQTQIITLYSDAVSAGAFKRNDEPIVDGDWYRSESVSEDMLDYNDLFDNDLSRN